MKNVNAEAMRKHRINTTGSQAPCKIVVPPQPAQFSKSVFHPMHLLLWFLCAYSSCFLLFSLSLSLSLWASSQICFQGQADRQTEDALSLSPSRHVDEDDERPFLLLSLSIIKAGKGRVWVEWESAKERERERERERVADLSFCCLTSCQTSSSPPLLSFI